MPTTAESILDELAIAFPAKRDGPFTPLVNSVLGDEPMLVSHAFRDKADWTALDPDWVEQIPEALNFLSNEAICFYIPAFIAADLKGRLGNADPVFALIHGFAHGVGTARIHPRKPRTWGDYARERWAGLTAPQARALVHYLEWQNLQDGPALSRGIAEALQNYWYERAAGA